MARDSDAPSPSRSEVMTSLTAELMFAADLLVKADLVPAGFLQDWVEGQRAVVTAEVTAAAGRFVGFQEATMGAIDFLVHNQAFHDPDTFLADLAQVSVVRYLEVLFNGDLTQEEVKTYLADPALARTMATELCSFSRATPEAHETLFRDPEGHRRDLITLVRGSDTPWFRATFDRWTQEARPLIRTLERRLVLEEPMELAQNLRKKLFPRIRQFDLHTFVVSKLTRHRQTRSWGANRINIFVQEGTVELAGPSETGAELADFLKVLADKTRMDIVRILAEGPSYGKEIAASLGLTTATVSRHLDQLKAAGLVREERADTNNVKRLRFDPQVLDDQVDRLKSYLRPS